MELKSYYINGYEVLQKLHLEQAMVAEVKGEAKTCIAYIVQGKEVVTAVSGREDAGAGESLLKQCHNYIAELQPSEDSGMVELIAVHFYPEVLREICVFHRPQMDRKAEVPSLAKGPNHTLIQAYFENLNEVISEGLLEDSSFLKVKLYELLLLLLRQGEGTAVQDMLEASFEPNMELRLRTVVEAHFYLPTSVDELAFLMAMSRSTFDRQFKKEYGQSPKAYLEHKKMQKARELMERTNASISEVADEVGISSVERFSKIFKKHFAISPSRYRLEKIGK